MADKLPIECKECFWLKFLAASVLLLPFRIVSADELPNSIPFRIRKIDEQLTQAGGSARVASTLYSELFGPLNETQISPFPHSHNTSIALQSAWELQLNLKAEPVRFIGFIEGRLRVVIPTRWEFIFLWQSLSNTPSQRDRIAQSFSKLEAIVVRREGRWIPQEPILNETELGISCLDGTRVTAKGSKVIIAKGSNKCYVDRNVYDSITKMNTGVDSCYVVFNETVALVAFSNPWGSRFPILCVELSSGNQLWKADCWAAGMERLYFLQGSRSHHLQMTVARGILMIFGSNSSACYIEGIDIASGKTQFRFSTNYWECRRH